MTDRSAASPWRAVFAVPVAVALTGVLVWAARDVDRVSSGTWDETIYLELARQLHVSGSREGFAALGVAPLPVQLIWDRAATAPLSAPTAHATHYRARLSEARQHAVWRAAVPCVLLFALLASTSGWAAGAVVATLLVLSPNVMAHASLATTDIAFAATTGLSLLALIGYLSSPTLVRGVALSVALGLALSTKYSALGLLASAVVVFAVRHRGRRWLGDGATLLGALVVAWAGHGWATSPLLAGDGRLVHVIEQWLGWSGAGGTIAAWLASVEAPIFVRGIAAQAYLDSAGQTGFLLGETSRHGWWYYFPVALALKATPVELVSLGVFAVLAVRRRARDQAGLVLPVAAAVFMLAAMASHRALGIRYVLPVLFIALAASVAWLAELFRGRPRLAAGVFGVAIVAQLSSFLSIAPNHLAYFNRWSGGPATGYQKLVDSNLDWGQDLPPLAEWLHRQGANRVTLAYFGSAPVTAYGFEPVSVRATAVGSAEAPRWVAISATLLQGAFGCPHAYAPFRALEADARAGYSIFIYALARPEVAAALRTAQGDPCLP